jgi:hypothetical protein
MKRQITVFYMFFMPFLFLASLFLGNITGREINFFPVLVCFLFFYMFTTLKAIYYYGVLSLYPIYLYTAFFFIYSRFYFHLTGYESFLTINFPVTHYFSDKVGVIFISAVFISHYIMDCVIYFRPLTTGNSNKIRPSPLIGQWGTGFMLFAFPVAVYKLYLGLLYVKQYGYLAIYSGQYPEINMPIWTRGSGTIFLIGYLMVLCSYPPRKKYILASVFFLVYLLIGSLRGGRGEFITYIVAIIYIYHKFYHKKISLYKTITVFLFIIAFSIMIGTSRETRWDNGSVMRAGDLLIQFFYGQGTSIGSPLTAIEASGQFENHSFPFIFSPLVYPFLSILYPNKGQTQILLEKYNDLGSISTHYLSPAAYFYGYGIGRTFIAEMYDFGGFLGIVFWSIMLALLILKTEKNFLRNRWCIIFYFGVIKTIIYLPRNVFFVFTQMLPYLVVIILMVGFMRSLTRGKRTI